MTKQGKSKKCIFAIFTGAFTGGFDLPGSPVKKKNVVFSSSKASEDLTTMLKPYAVNVDISSFLYVFYRFLYVDTGR